VRPVCESEMLPCLDLSTGSIMLSIKKVCRTMSHEHEQGLQVMQSVRAHISRGQSPALARLRAHQRQAYGSTGFSILAGLCKIPGTLSTW
jgi:hypothetical protein